MFAILVTVLLLAVFTDVEENVEFDKQLGIGEEITKHSALRTAVRDSLQ